jgi:hypothetical protein
LGTIFPQVGATINLFDQETLFQGGGVGTATRLLNGSIILVGTLTTLIYFGFGVKAKSGTQADRPLWLRLPANIGQVFISITFGVLFAGVYAAALIALIERIHSIVQLIFSFFGM